MKRQIAQAAFDAAVASCNPEQAIAANVHVLDRGVRIGGAVYSEVQPSDIVVISIGKAAASMARGVHARLGDVRGVAVANADTHCPMPLVVGDHPIPGTASLEAGRRVIGVVDDLDPTDFVLFLVSGGGSAIVEAPVDGVSMADLAAMNDILIRCGCPIEDINEVRSAVSRLKGGRLGNMVSPNQSATLVVSDIVGAGPQHVASGPSIGHGLGGRAQAVVEQWGLAEDLPTSILAALERPALGSPPAQPHSVVVASPHTAAVNAVDELTRKGLPTHLLTDELLGPSDVAVADVLSALGQYPAVVAAGETTVNVPVRGVGGRNQHAALIAALAIEGTDRVFGAFGTDGVDGPTDAAGAIVDGGSTERMRKNGVDPGEAIASYTSNVALGASGDLVITGSTGTNVADVWVAIA